MRAEQLIQADPRIADALHEIQRLIAAHYLDARFDVFEGEDPEGVYLRAEVDIEDSSDALEPVLDKLHELQVERELPVYVVTDQPLERVGAHLATRIAKLRSRLSQLSL